MSLELMNGDEGDERGDHDGSRRVGGRPQDWYSTTKNMLTVEIDNRVQGITCRTSHLVHNIEILLPLT